MWDCALCGRLVCKNNLTQHTAIHHLDEPLLRCRSVLRPSPIPLRGRLSLRLCPYTERYAGLNVRKHIRSTHPGADADDFVDLRPARRALIAAVKSRAFFQ